MRGSRRCRFGIRFKRTGFEAQKINEIMEAKDASGETLGYAVNVTTSEGYGGDITFLWVSSLMEL